MENIDKIIESYFRYFSMSDSTILDFRDELQEDELKKKIIKLIEEHCEIGFKEWEKWSSEYDNFYPQFLQLMKIQQMDMLLGEYRIYLK